jgi:hypothetical protein
MLGRHAADPFVTLDGHGSSVKEGFKGAQYTANFHDALAAPPIM